MTETGEDDIAVSVFDEIDEEGFDGPMVELLLVETIEGQIDLMGDVLMYLASKQHADWAAELCRCVRQSISACTSSCSCPSTQMLGVPTWNMHIN